MKSAKSSTEIPRLTVDREFSDFFASQYARLCWLGCALTGSPVQAEELAQDALVRTWWRWRLVGRPKDPASYARKSCTTPTPARAAGARNSRPGQSNPLLAAPS